MSSWYKREPSKFIGGVVGLGPDVIGAYTIILDLIYQNDGPVADDARYLGGILGCSSRKAASLVARLVEVGNVTRSSDGRLWAPIVDEMKAATGREAIPQEVRRVVAERDGNVCRYCGDESGPFHLDHIFPVSRGGTNEVTNLTVACATCNLSKGAKTLGEWLQ